MVTRANNIMCILIIRLIRMTKEMKANWIIPKNSAESLKLQLETMAEMGLDGSTSLSCKEAPPPLKVHPDMRKVVAEVEIRGGLLAGPVG